MNTNTPTDMHLHIPCNDVVAAVANTLQINRTPFRFFRPKYFELNMKVHKKVHRINILCSFRISPPPLVDVLAIFEIFKKN